MAAPEENYLYEGIVVTTFGVIDGPTEQTPIGSPSPSILLAMMI